MDRKTAVQHADDVVTEIGRVAGEHIQVTWLKAYRRRQAHNLYEERSGK